MSRKPLPRRFFLLPVVAFLCVMGWLVTRVQTAKTRTDAAAPSSAAPTPAAAPTQRPDAPQIVTQNVVIQPRPRSPLADKLNAADKTPADDVKTVLLLVDNFLIALKQVPTGTNREITAALSGRNALKLAPLPPDNPAISPDGELLDRWGHPYAFHCLTRHTVEIRSRGPDGVLFTPDDVTIANGPVPSPFAVAPTAP